MQAFLPARVSRLWLTLTGTVGSLLFVLFRTWTPSDDPSATICIWRRMGVPCPGCGLTRGMAQTVQGDLAEAVAYHPLAPVLFVEAVVAWLFLAAVVVGWARLPSRRIVNAVLAVHFVVLLAVWTVRASTGTLPY